MDSDSQGIQPLSTQCHLIQSIFYNNPDQYPPIINGTRLLARNGYSVEILCRENGGRWEVSYPASVRIQRIDKRSGSSWREYFGYVLEVLRRGSNDIALFIGHDMHGFLPARLLASRYRRPVLYHCHDFTERDRQVPLGGRIVRAFEQRFARTADLVVVPDRERGRIMADALELIKPPHIAANAPLDSFQGTGAALQAALAEQNKRFDRILLRQGRIGKGHAIEVTIRSMVRWASRKWGFVLLGWGEPAYQEEILRLAGDLGVAEQLVILPPVGYDHLIAFTPGAHLGSALYEPILFNHAYATTASNKMMEYMACGLPVLLSERPASKSFLERYHCGLAVDVDSLESIAEAVNILLGKPDVAQQMGIEGRKAFEQEFCYERQYAPVLAEIDRLTCNLPDNT